MESLEEEREVGTPVEILLEAVRDRNQGMAGVQTGP